MSTEVADAPQLKQNPRARLARRIRKSPRRTRGQGLVEFAFCAPLMLLLLLGTLDFGQIFFEYIQMRNAVREGAVYAARYSKDGNADIELAVRESSGTGGVLDNLDTAISIEWCTDGTCTSSIAGGFATDTVVTVTATRVFEPTILSFFERFGLGEVTMTASSTAQVWT